MNKRELKTGMIVVTREGKEYMVIRNLRAKDMRETNVLVGVEHSGYCFFSSFNEDLTANKGDRDFDIMEVFMIDYAADVIYNNKERTLIWRRKEKKTYTYAQLQEILGTEFEVVG